MKFLMVLSLQNQLKLYLHISLVDGDFDWPSIIYDSIRTIKHVSVVFFSVKTSSTHYHGAVWLTKWPFIYPFIPTHSTLNGYLSLGLEINKVYGNGLAMFGRLVVCTVYTNKITLVQLKLRLGLH